MKRYEILMNRTIEEVAKDNLINNSESYGLLRASDGKEFYVDVVVTIDWSEKRCQEAYQYELAYLNEEVCNECGSKYDKCAATLQSSVDAIYSVRRGN